MTSRESQPTRAAGDPAGLAVQYQAGVGNEHQSEALPGALPVGRSSPQRPPHGLYAEKLSGTAFTVPRAHSLRSWFYRIHPSVKHGVFERVEHGLLREAPITEIDCPPDQLRWDPFPLPAEPCDFVDGLTTLAAGGNLRRQDGLGIHLYLANQSMQERFFYNADGELLIVPQKGELILHTEFGVLLIQPGEIAVIPRGVKFRVVLTETTARGYVAENYGVPLRLPERGLVGSDGFANDRDFLFPVADFEDREGDFRLSCKFLGNLFESPISASPLDVVAWYGNYAPYKYELRRFNAMGSVSYDHPDPSINTVLSSPSDRPGTANLDFVIFPPVWLVAEDTFRPPWYHRNFMNEFMGLIHGSYGAKQKGFVPGGASLHNCMQLHGPDAEAYAKASRGELEPTLMADSMAFMFESRYVLQPTRFALEALERQRDYSSCWQGLEKQFGA